MSDQIEIRKPIINANIGITNRIEEKKIESIIMDTFDDILSVLSDHCGPYGKFSMIVNPTNLLAEPVFTKDGIGIVRAMEYASPIQDYARQMLDYMGSRVETSAGDGTTSSMIICANAIRELIKELKKILMPVSYAELVDEYKKFVDKITNALEENKFKADDKTIKRIAYYQAYTSSHGNIELSKAIAEIFSKTPERAWNYLYIDKCKYESDKDYTIAEDDSQYTLQNVAIYPKFALTEDLGTARIRKNSKTLISAFTPSHGIAEGEELFNSIKNAFESDEELNVIIPKGMESSILAEIDAMATEHPDNKVAIFVSNDDDPKLNDITCVKVLANKFDITSEIYIDYEYRNGDLKITGGLYENPNNSKINPMVGDKEHYPEFNKLLEHLDIIINQIKSEVSNRYNNEAVVTLQKRRLKLTVAKRNYFLIGGAAIDNAAAVDVVIDAMLATKHTLTKGFCLGGCRTLYNVLNKYSVSCKKNNDTNYIIQRIFCKIFMNSIELVHKFNCKWFKQKPDFCYTRSFDIMTMNRPTKNKDIDPGMILAMQDKEFEKYISNKDNPSLIIQPVSTDKELIKRFGELALKFVKTIRIISPGGICIKE